MLVLASLASAARAGNFSSSGYGTTAAGFLDLGVGGRALGMGGAYTAVADEASALYWNPAAMRRVPDASATFMRMQYLAASSLDWASYVKNLGRYGALGVGFDYFSAGSIEETDAAFNSIGSFTPYDLALSAGYAATLRRSGLLSGFSAGLAAKFIKSKILNSAQTAAVDWGVLSPGYLGGKLRLALAMRNLGGDLKYEQVAEPLPLTMTAGSAYRIDQRWIASLDGDFPRSGDPYVEAGTEYWLVEDGPWKFAGRAGYSSRTLQNVTGFSGTSLGIGLDYGGMAIDYAFIPYGGLGVTQQISLTYQFAPSVRGPMKVTVILPAEERRMAPKREVFTISAGCARIPVADTEFDFRELVNKSDLSMAALKGNAIVEYALGTMYAKGEGVAQDYAKAALWTCESAAQGYPPAQFHLGYFYYTGKGVGRQDYGRALKWFGAAAQKGYALAQFDLGLMHYRGQGVPKDFGAALSWFQKAAGRNVAIAQYYVGLMNERGEGTAKNVPAALGWYRKAAVQDFPRALKALRRLEGRK